MSAASLEQNMTAARHQHLVPGRELHMQDMRGYRFCEVGLITGNSQDNAVANIWNTTGACDPTPEQLVELDADPRLGCGQGIRPTLSGLRALVGVRTKAA